MCFKNRTTPGGPKNQKYFENPSQKRGDRAISKITFCERVEIKVDQPLAQLLSNLSHALTSDVDTSKRT